LRLSEVVLYQQRVILFGTGACFSVAVLDQLLGYGLKPLALVLPEFAPSELMSVNEIPVDVISKNNQFVTRASQLSIPLIYLPEPSQSVQVEAIVKLNVDFLLVACWPYLLNSQTIGTAGKAALNMHPSLLPKYRGANPVSDQIERQEKKLGVSLHLLSQEFDKGDIIGQAEIKFTTLVPGRDVIEVEAARVGSMLFMKAINEFGSLDWDPRPQH
jgi:methionyl-tRNA formyltransferase